MKFNKLLKIHRIKCELTQDELAERLGWKGNAYINHIESGRRSPPDPKVLKKMANVLDLNDKERFDFWNCAFTGKLNPDLLKIRKILLTEFPTHSIEKAEQIAKEAFQELYKDEDIFYKPIIIEIMTTLTSLSEKEQNLFLQIVKAFQISDPKT